MVGCEVVSAIRDVHVTEQKLNKNDVNNYTIETLNFTAREVKKIESKVILTISNLQKQRKFKCKLIC